MSSLFYRLKCINISSILITFISIGCVTMTFVFSRIGFGMFRVIQHWNLPEKFSKIYPYPRNTTPKPKNRRITELEARNSFISNRLETYDSQIAGEQTRVQEIIDMVSVWMMFIVKWPWLMQMTHGSDSYVMTGIRLNLDLWFTNVQLGRQLFNC